MSETPEAVAWRYIAKFLAPEQLDNWHLSTTNEHVRDDPRYIVEPLVPLVAYQSAIQERDALKAELEAAEDFGAQLITGVNAAEASNASLRQQLDGVAEVAVREIQRSGHMLRPEELVVTVAAAIRATLKSSEPKE